jgi:hypothetical protein
MTTAVNEHQSTCVGGRTSQRPVLAALKKYLRNRVLIKLNWPAYFGAALLKSLLTGL